MVTTLQKKKTAKDIQKVRQDAATLLLTLRQTQRFKFFKLSSEQLALPGLRTQTISC